MTRATTSSVRWLIPSSMPRSRARSSFSSLEALPITKAPAIRASCTAAEPMPLPTELIITVSPARRLPRVNSMCQEVANATWSAAASSYETESGTRIRFLALTTTRSA